MCQKILFNFYIANSWKENFLDRICYVFTRDKDKVAGFLRVTYDVID